jgi:malonyl CoA-acyl carrier protein transacylase
LSELDLAKTKIRKFKISHNADALSQTLQSIRLDSPRMVYVSNVRARALRTAAEIAWDLANNIAHGVRWFDAMTVLQELGCNVFVEMPPEKGSVKRVSQRFLKDLPLQ